MQSEKKFAKKGKGTTQIQESSQVSAIYYKDSTLTVTYHSGKTYSYYDVPENVWKSALEAVSIGSFLAQYVKNMYTYTQL